MEYQMLDGTKRNALDQRPIHCDDVIRRQKKCIEDLRQNKDRLLNVVNQQGRVIAVQQQIIQKLQAEKANVTTFDDQQPTLATMSPTSCLFKPTIQSQQQNINAPAPMNWMPELAVHCQEQPMSLPEEATYQPTAVQHQQQNINAPPPMGSMPRPAAQHQQHPVSLSEEPSPRSTAVQHQQQNINAPPRTPQPSQQQSIQFPEESTRRSTTVQFEQQPRNIIRPTMPIRRRAAVPPQQRITTGLAPNNWVRRRAVAPPQQQMPAIPASELPLRSSDPASQFAAFQLSAFQLEQQIPATSASETSIPQTPAAPPQQQMPAILASELPFPSSDPASQFIAFPLRTFRPEQQIPATSASETSIPQTPTALPQQQTPAIPAPELSSHPWVLAFQPQPQMPAPPAPEEPAPPASTPPADAPPTKEQEADHRFDSPAYLEKKGINPLNLTGTDLEKHWHKVIDDHWERHRPECTAEDGRPCYLKNKCRLRTWGILGNYPWVNPWDVDPDMESWLGGEPRKAD